MLAGEVKTYMGLKGSRLSVAIAICAGTDLALFGYDQGVMGGLLNLPSFTSVFPEICTASHCLEGMTEKESYHQSVIQGIVVACYSLGCALGALLTSRYGNVLGRCRAILLGSSIMVVGAVLQGAAFWLPMFIVGRVICGIGNGINTSTVPVWQSECSKPHHRGRTVAFDLSLLILGLALAYWIDFGFSFTEPSSIAWRFPLLFQCTFALMVIALILFLPESPRWLILRGREEEARQTLSAIYDVPADHAVVDENIRAIQSSLVVDQVSSFKDLFTFGPERHFQRTMLGCAGQMCQQLTGINVIAYYQVSIFEDQLDLSPMVSRILAGCTSTVFFLSTIPAIFTFDRFGRRKVTLFSSTGMMICLCIMAGCMSRTTTATGAVATLMIFLYNLFFAFGWELLAWIYPSEVLPVTIRAQGNALAVTTNWLFAFMVVMVTPVMFNSLGWKSYIIYAVFNAAMLPMIYYLYPETAGRSLEEMDVIFVKSRNPFDVVRVAKTHPRHYDRKGELISSVAADLESTILAPAHDDKSGPVSHLEASQGN